MHKQLGDKKEYEQNLIIGRNMFGDMGLMSSWELYWCITAAEMAGDLETAEQARKEQSRRKRKDDSITAGRGLLPQIGDQNNTYEVDDAA